MPGPGPSWAGGGFATLLGIVQSRHEENLRRFEAVEKGLTELRRYVIFALAAIVMLVLSTIAQVAAHIATNGGFHVSRASPSSNRNADPGPAAVTSPAQRQWGCDASETYGGRGLW